jgi:hypothetical protein
VDSFWAWGAQIEAGSFATSYIPTTNASVVRSADVCSISGANFSQIINQPEATIYFSGSRYQNSATSASRSWALSSGTSATESAALKFGTTESLGTGTGASILTTGTMAAPFQQLKTAHAIKSGNYAGSQNGLSAVVSTNAFAVVVDRLNIGSSFTATSHIGGYISEFKVYRKRLSNAKLVQLTV